MLAPTSLGTGGSGMRSGPCSRWGSRAALILSPLPLKYDYLTIIVNAIRVAEPSGACRLRKMRPFTRPPSSTQYSSLLPIRKYFLAGESRRLAVIVVSETAAARTHSERRRGRPNGLSVTFEKKSPGNDTGASKTDAGVTATV